MKNNLDINQTQVMTLSLPFCRYILCNFLTLRYAHTSFSSPTQIFSCSIQPAGMNRTLLWRLSMRYQAKFL